MHKLKDPTTTSSLSLCTEQGCVVAENVVAAFSLLWSVHTLTHSCFIISSITKWYELHPYFDMQQKQLQSFIHSIPLPTWVDDLTVHGSLGGTCSRSS